MGRENPTEGGLSPKEKISEQALEAARRERTVETWKEELMEICAKNPADPTEKELDLARTLYNRKQLGLTLESSPEEVAEAERKNTVQTWAMELKEIGAIDPENPTEQELDNARKQDELKELDLI